MCQFCVQHGDGKTWYLQAQNYLADLESDIERRDFMFDFVQNFEKRQPGRHRGMRILDRIPDPIASAVKGRLEARQREHHFGQPVPIEDCERIFDFATSIVRLPCVCRTSAGTPDNGYCLAVTMQPVDDRLREIFAGYESGPDTNAFQRLSKDEALSVLRQCEREGLMHSVWTFITPMIAAICNCDLKSGCMAMTATIGHDLKVMWKGENVIRFAEESCTRCGACAPRCPFGALSWNRTERVLTYDESACYGCGTCRSACRSEALSLIPRQPVLATEA